MKKPLNERMEEARLDELMPGFDKDAEWTRLSAKLHPEKKRVFTRTWLRAAAAVLLLAASGSTVWYLAKNNTTDGAVSQSDTDTRNEWSKFSVPEMNAANSGDNQTTNSTTDKALVATSVSIPGKNKNEQLSNYKRTGEFVCNGTPCPIEICIIQSIKCKNEKPSAIATCSILEPDQAHQLHYKAPEGLGAHCKVTVEEIRIRRITTGETIVLNSDSKPSTAEELFDCLTGEIKCNLLAGVFHTDCNNQKKPHNLKIGNDHGNLIVQ